MHRVYVENMQYIWIIINECKYIQYLTTWFRVNVYQDVHAWMKYILHVLQVMNHGLTVQSYIAISNWLNNFLTSDIFKTHANTE